MTETFGFETALEGMKVDRESWARKKWPEGDIMKLADHRDAIVRKLAGGDATFMGNLSSEDLLADDWFRVG